MRGRIEFPVLNSNCLKDNALGDPSDREVLVYLPPGYDEAGAYPLVVVLMPYAATHRSLCNYRPWEDSLFTLYESLLEGGELGPMILCAPDCMTRWGGSQFLDSPVQGRYQSWLVEELLPFMDARYATIPRPGARAVIGRSSGGFGALRLGLDRPGHVAVYASHAGDSAFEASIRPSFTRVAITLDRAGGLMPFLEGFEANGPRGSGDFEAIMTLASATAYAADPTLPFPHVRLPFELRSAAVVEEVWSRWLAQDPLALIREKSSAFSDASLVFLDAGDRDEYGLHFGARQMHQLLRDRGVACTYEEFPGGHRGTAYRYAHSLPRVFEALETE